MGIPCAEADDPYTAMLLICQRPNHFAAVVLSLYSLYREELQIIPALASRFRQLPIWLTHAQGRQAACDEAIRLGAKGVLDMDGSHLVTQSGQLAVAVAASDAGRATTQPAEVQPVEAAESRAGGSAIDEPVLSAEELRALLDDQPAGSGPATEM
jgi:hypothetical protein